MGHRIHDELAPRDAKSNVGNAPGGFGAGPDGTAHHGRIRSRENAVPGKSSAAEHALRVIRVCHPRARGVGQRRQGVRVPIGAEIIPAPLVDIPPHVVKPVAVRHVVGRAEIRPPPVDVGGPVGDHLRPVVISHGRRPEGFSKPRMPRMVGKRAVSAIPVVGLHGIDAVEIEIRALDRIVRPREMRPGIPAAAGFLPFRLRRKPIARRGYVHAPVRRREVHRARQSLAVAQVVADGQRAVPRREQRGKVRLAGSDGERAVGKGDLAVGLVQIHQFLRRALHVANRAVEVRDHVRHLAGAVGENGESLVYFHQSVGQSPLQRPRHLLVGEFEPANEKLAHRHVVNRHFRRPAFAGKEI